MLDRLTAPAINSISRIDIIRASEQKLSNGIPVYSVNAGTQDLLKIEFLFNAGIWYQPAPLVAGTVNDLVHCGTSKRSAQEIAESIDYYGAFLETEVAHDFANVSVFTLSKYLGKVLPVLEEILKDAVFPSQEILVNLQNKKQKHIVDEQKVQKVARKKLSQLLFGDAHPYGYYVKQEDFDNVNREDLVAFYKQYYTPANCRIIVSGKINESVASALEKHFGNWKGPAGSGEPAAGRWPLASGQPSAIVNASAGRHIVSKPDALQSAIRIGRILFNKTHPDYLGLTVLNTVLGGYFGSRLMSNIREDKGYTYGIGSAVASFSHAGYFFISTEVGSDVCGKAVDEIYSELERLRKEEVRKEELDLVRNYMLGSFLGDIDGPFHLASAFKAIMVYGLGYDFYERYIHTIRTISPAELMQLAGRYLCPDDMVEIVVGKK